MANLNTGNFADAIKVYYEKRLLTRALPRLVHARFGPTGVHRQAETTHMWRPSTLAPDLGLRTPRSLDHGCGRASRESGFHRSDHRHDQQGWACLHYTLFAT